MPQRNSLSRRHALMMGAGVLGALTAMTAGERVVEGQTPTPGAMMQSPVPPMDESAWQGVEMALGNTHGRVVQPDGVFRIDLARDDLQPTLFGVSVKPDLGFDTTITFTQFPTEAVVKYELALLDSEVNPVMAALFNKGLQPAGATVTALHNHFMEASPNVMFLHGFARGDAVAIASSLYQALSQTKTPFGHGMEPQGDAGFDVQQVQNIVGFSGMLTNGVLEIEAPRAEQVLEYGVGLPPAMQVSSMGNFQATDNGQVAMVAELAVLPEEIDSVARILQAHMISVTAVHNHEVQISPTLYYLHGGGMGTAMDLATALRAALDQMNILRPFPLTPTPGA